ncbi:hypothetical protein Ciccas_000059 [Cichlidogyrus casuarinus]|uniref:Uncharacterized protein n=1 Tax=Cichlidogyrus casuarinus TaxID=1844966 RepID=A0ABD2QS30_9PLAT
MFKWLVERKKKIIQLNLYEKDSTGLNFIHHVIRSSISPACLELLKHYFEITIDLGVRTTQGANGLHLIARNVRTAAAPVAPSNDENPADDHEAKTDEPNYSNICNTESKTSEQGPHIPAAPPITPELAKAMNPGKSKYTPKLRSIHLNKRIGLTVNKLKSNRVLKNLQKVIDDVDMLAGIFSVEPVETIQDIPQIDIELDEQIKADLEKAKAGQICFDSVMQYLIDNGVDINAKDLAGSTPLHYTANRGNEVAIMQLLANKKLEINVSIKIELIELQATDDDLTTPLHLAATYNQTEIAKLLIYRGADLYMTNKNGLTPLHIAVTDYNDALVKIMLESVKKKKGTGLLLNLLEKEDNYRRTALHLAVTNGHDNLALYLIYNGSNIHAISSKEDSCLHLAAKSKSSAITSVLITNGADTSYRNEDLQNSLHFTSYFNSPNVAELLLSNSKLNNEEKYVYSIKVMLEKYGPTLRLVVKGSSP